MSARHLLAALASLAALQILSGCGASDTFSAKDVAAAANASAAKVGARIAITSQTSLPGAGQLSMSGEGAIDARTQRGHLTLRATRASGLPSSVDKGDLTQEVVFDDLRVYLRSPSLAGTLKRGKKWAKLDLAKAGRAAGLDLSSLTQGGQDPTQSLRLLKAVSGDVKKVGQEQVRGVKTTHYKATIDLEKYPDTVPSKERAAARATIESLGRTLGGTRSPVEVWIGEDNLVRRFAQSLKVKAAAAGTSSIRQRLEFYDYGTKVDVTIPPAAEVQDLTDVAAAGLRGSAP